MNNQQILKRAMEIFSDRGDQYGEHILMFDAISQTASAVLDKEFTPYEIAMIFHCAKLCRTRTSRKDMDHYIDGINYLAFAGQFADKD